MKKDFNKKMKYKNGKVLKLARTGSRINEQLSVKKKYLLKLVQ